MSRQAQQAEELHDDGQRRTLSHTNFERKGSELFNVAERAPLRGPATRKPPAMPGDGYCRTHKRYEAERVSAKLGEDFHPALTIGLENTL